MSVKDMPLEDFLRVLDEEVTPNVNPRDVLIIFSGGEVLMRKDLEQAGREVAKRGYPWGIYLGTSFLSILLLPQKMPGVTYLLFAFYPILKAYFERAPRPLAFCLKQVTFVVIEIAYIVASHLILGIEKMPFWYNATLIVMGYLTLNLFDMALTKLISRYLCRYRARVARWMN
jgi:hypothetical protein